MDINRKFKSLAIPWLAGLVIMLALGAVPAYADTISFDLTIPNSAISPYTGPYATVTVNLTDSTHATITFTALTNGGYSYLMGDGSTVALNVNATSFTVGSVVDPAWKASNIFSQQVDGFGQFNFTIDNKDGFDQALSSVQFTLTNAGGTWSSASNVLTPNEGGSTAASHIFVPGAAGSGALATGYAANGSQVPEPASLALFGSGLVALAGIIRKRRKNVS